MSFFSDNGKVSTATSVAAEGAYVCSLLSVEVKDEPSFKDVNVLEPRFTWIFQALEEVNEYGDPWKFYQFTGVSYGYEGSGLTKLIDSMAGRRLTDEEFLKLDLEKLQSKKWRVLVSETLNQKGLPRNQIVSVKPFVVPAGSAPQASRGVPQPPTSPVQSSQPRRAVSKPSPVEDDLEGLVDPFADD